MKNPSHRSIRKKRLRRIHPNNQTLIVDTTLGRKKYIPPTLPVLNLPSLAPTTIAPYHHHHHHHQQNYQQQQQQQRHRRREGLPSPPAYLRASVIFLPVPIHPPAPVALPIPPRPVSTASSAYNQHYQQYQQPLRQPCHSHYPQHALQPSVATAAAHTTQGPATTLPTYHRIAQKPIQKPGDRYPKQHQLPKQRGANPHTSNRASQANTHSYSSPSCWPPKRFPNNLWSPRKIYHSLAKGPASENSFADRGQREQGERRAQYGPGHDSKVTRPRSFPPAETNSTTTTTMTKKGDIHLGFAAYMITSFMLAYNGIMSVLLLQASRVLDDTNVPVFIFSLVFLFTAILSIFGFLALSLSSWTLIRVFHTMYLFTATLTFAMMFGWLGVNQSQTGAWDRIMLDNGPRSVSASSPPAPIATTAEDVNAMWLKSILNMDPTTGTWIISPWQWILAFTTIFVCQCACWYYGLLAYDRQVLDRKLGKWNNFNSDIDSNNDGGPSRLSFPEKV